MEDVKHSLTPLERRLMNMWFGHIFSLNIAVLVSWVVSIRIYFKYLKVSDGLEVSKPLTNF